MDRVLVDYLSSWTWVHDQFGVSNEESVISFMDRDMLVCLDSCAGTSPCGSGFRRRDWPCDVERELAVLPINPGIGMTVRALQEKGHER